MPASADLPSITVLLTGHNEAHCIRQAIESIFNQDYQGSVQIIMGDDGSQDATYAVMQQMAAAYTGPYDILLHHNPTPLGRGYHIRQLAGLATGDWIIRQDGDDCSFPWRLSTFAAAARTHPDAAAIMSDVTAVEEIPGEKFHFPPFPKKPAHIPIKRETEPFVAGIHGAGNMLIHRRIFDYAADLPMTATIEDNLLAFYAWTRGEFYIMPHISLYYYRSALKNIFAHGKACRFVNYKTAKLIQERERLSIRNCIKVSSMILNMCRRYINDNTPCFRSKAQLQQEIDLRIDNIAWLEQKLNWWQLPFSRRWSNKPPHKQGMVKCLPEPVYLLIMVLYYKWFRLKRRLFNK